MHFILDMTSGYLMTKFLFDIKLFIFKKVLSYKGIDLANLSTGDICYRMNKDTEEIINFIYADVFYGIAAFLELLLYMGFTAYISLPFAFISLSLSVFTIIMTKYFAKKIKPIYAKIAKITAVNESWLFELIKGMRDIKLLAASRYCSHIFMRNNIKVVRQMVEKTKYEVQSERSNEAMNVLSTIIIYVAAALFILAGTLTLGGFVACVDYFKRMIMVFNRLNTKFMALPGRMIAIDRILEIGKMDSEDYKENIAHKPIKLGEIVFEDVHFSYNNNSRIIDGISLHIKPGECISLVGRSGTGKSTIVSLLCKLYDIDNGRITIDGTSIDDYNLHDLRRQVGIVHQETILFDNSIRFNIAFTNNPSFDEEIWSILNRVQLSEYVKGLPHGLNTILDSTVLDLSGGQKQRIALARLFLKNPPILIFDEATSSLDSETELGIINTLSDLFRSRTILIIAHRLSTIINSDKVACLEDGKIVGYGNHYALLKKCKAYQLLFSEQYKLDSSAVVHE